MSIQSELEKLDKVKIHDPVEISNKFFPKKSNNNGGFLKKIFRYRSLFLFGGALLGAIISYKTDPDTNGLSTLLGGLAIIQGVWAVAAAHLGRKALTDYAEADQNNLFAKASEHPIGAGLALIALAIIFVGLLSVFSPRAHADELPPGFIKYGPVLKHEQKRYWPEHPDPSVLAGLVEQESCPTLSSQSCWNPAAQLKTAREEGAGMGQLTRAVGQNGYRFDSLANLVKAYPSELAGLSWNNVYVRPDLQLRAIVLLSKDSATPFREATEWLVFGDAAYNGGIAGVQKERRACKLTTGCNPDLWFGHVERLCLKSRQPIYGGRSACDINRAHAYNVFLIRKNKYGAFMNN
jgi:hypothetical protein